MLRELQKYAAARMPVEMVYLNRQGQFSRRLVRIQAICGERVKAYCFARRASRVFLIANILAVSPVRRASGY